MAAILFDSEEPFKQIDNTPSTESPRNGKSGETDQEVSE